MSSHEITHLIHEYGLIVVFLATMLQSIGFPIPGGTALVAGGIDAHTKGGLPLVGVIAAGALGALVGTSIGYAIGHWRGEPVLIRIGKIFRQKPERIQELRHRFEEHAFLPLFIARFITGLRNVAGLVAGASGLALTPFLAISALAATAWSTIITVEYYFAGHTFLGAPTWLQITLVIVGILATIASLKLLRPGMLGGSAAAPAKPADAAE